MTERVPDPADPRLADYIGLTDVVLRRRKEPLDGLFIAEGEKVIRRAFAAGFPLRSMLLEEKWLPGLHDLVETAAAPVYVASREVLDAATGYAVHRGALAAMGRRPLPEASELLAGATRLVVLEDVNDHTNIGAIFRAAAGLGVDAVLLNPRCADPLYRRAVKVSMGAVFAVPYARLSPWPDGLAILREAGVTVAAMALAAEATDLGSFVGTLPDRLALMFGAEGPGLSARSVLAADVVLRIPMTPAVDSLNVAAAAAVALWATRDQSRR